MNIEEYREYCISKRGVTEGFPFDQSTLVFKVMGKMFALTSIDNFEFINLKADPEYSADLREEYNGIKPGYHMSKVHWNSVYTEQDVPTELILKLIDDSYNLIVSSLTKKLKEELAQL